MPRKTELLKLRVTPEVKQSLEWVAAEYNISLSEAIRQIIGGQAAHTREIKMGYQEFNKRLEVMRQIVNGKIPDKGTLDDNIDKIFLNSLQVMRRILELMEKRSGQGTKAKRLAEP